MLRLDGLGEKSVVFPAVSEQQNELEEWATFGDAGVEKHLQGLCEEGCVLLRVERAPKTGPSGARRSERLRLTFDKGAIDFWPSEGALACGSIDSGQALLNADEDEPWWTVLGHPLTRVAPQPGGGVLVQFRPDDASPKLFVLSCESDAVATQVVV